jgi:hypothetical protein
MNAPLDPLFVGRNKEIEWLRRELAAGSNVVLTGRFGAGRTALLRHLAGEEEPVRRFVFVNGALPPGPACQQLFLALFPKQARALERACKPQSFMRATIESRCLPDRRPHVVVLDDVAKLTPQRLEFLRWLRGLEKFRIIAVAERFLPEEDLWRLRTLLVPAPLLVLRRLGAAACEQFFRSFSQREGLAWDEGTIQGLARASGGYPLTLWELASTARGKAPSGEGRGEDAQARGENRFSWISGGRTR